MPTDNVQLKVEFKGRRNELEQGLVRAIDEALINQTGLKREGVTFKDDQVYHVKIESPSVVEVAQGTSTESIDDAIRTATKQGALDFGDTPIAVSLERTAETPYFTVPVTSRSLYSDSLDDIRKANSFELAATYGNRFSPQLESASFRVIKTSQVYSEDKKLPQGEIPGIIAEGNGKTLQAATKSINLDRKAAKKVRTTIYEQTARVMIYGVPERSFTDIRRGALVSSSATVESSRAGRASTPAGREPTYFKPASDLM